MTKPRSDAKLLNLPAAQQSTLTQWLLDGLAYHIIQQRLLAEFQIECSAMAVSRYWHKVVQPLLAHQRAHLLDRAKFIEKSNAQQPHAVDLLVTDLLEQRLLELLSDPANLPDDPEKLVELLCRLRRQKLREEALALQAKIQCQKAAAAAEAAKPSKPVDYNQPFTPEQRQAVISKMKEICGLDPVLPPRIPDPPGMPTWEEIREPYKNDPCYAGQGTCFLLNADGTRIPFNPSDSAPNPQSELCNPQSAILPHPQTPANT